MGEEGPAHWSVFFSPRSKSCWLVNGCFPQGKKCCPDEWWVCLGTCWTRSSFISKGVLARGLTSFISRPAQVPSPQTPPCLPPYLSSLALPGHLPSSPSISHQTRRDGGLMLESLHRNQEQRQPTCHTGLLPRHDIAKNCVFQWLQTGRTSSTTFTLVVPKDYVIYFLNKNSIIITSRPFG